MTFQEFDEFFASLVSEIKSISKTKGKEYANSEERFANFNRLASRLNLPRLHIAEVYLTKHLDAIESYISKGRTYSEESIHGRIVDAILYLSLIAGMIQEEEKDLERKMAETS